MKLVYHEGKNFGDALNPLIFSYYLGDLLEKKDDNILLGIGSILGLKQGFSKEIKKVVFSSGYAAGMEDTYGKIPTIDDSYDVICVRGPKTAKLLNLNADLAISDGAILLYDLIKNKEREKKYKFTFIPHTGTEKKFDYKEKLEKLGIHYLSPTNEVEFVIEEILSSEYIIAEAMHGAIVADALRIPWCPIKLYPTINEFKWMDYCESVGIEYKPIYITGPFNDKEIQNIFLNKFRSKSLSNFFSFLYKIYRFTVLEVKLKKQFSKIIGSKKFHLSNEKILQSKVLLLKEKLEQLKSKYQINEDRY